MDSTSSDKNYNTNKLTLSHLHPSMKAELFADLLRRGETNRPLYTLLERELEENGGIVNDVGGGVDDCGGDTTSTSTDALVITCLDVNAAAAGSSNRTAANGKSRISSSEESVTTTEDGSSSLPKLDETRKIDGMAVEDDEDDNVFTIPYENVSKNDVIRCPGNVNHFGNDRLKDLVMQKQPAYAKVKGSKVERELIIQDIITNIHGNGGRFLSRHPSKELYRVLPFGDTYSKVKISLGTQFCTYPNGCNRRALTKGLCSKHGGRKICRHSDGCNKPAQRGGYCSFHGGKALCKYVNDIDGTRCTKQAQVMGFCCKHGGNKRCKIEGCSCPAQKFRLCSRHLKQHTGENK